MGFARHLVAPYLLFRTHSSPVRALPLLVFPYSLLTLANNDVFSVI